MDTSIPAPKNRGHAAPGQRLLSDSIELLSSMRFAISLLCIIAIASVIGTVLQQNQPMPNYVNQFGPFWFEVFASLSLYNVYSAWWFLLIMTFLVLSTSLCVIRNAPKMLKDMRSWRDNVREQALGNFHHKFHVRSQLDVRQLSAQVQVYLQKLGYKVKVTEKEQALLLSAKQGAANKWGYILAHSAIVMICIGGILDSDLPIRCQQWFMGKVPFSGNGIIAQIPQQHRLSLANPTFRGNALIPEGATTNTVILQQQEGVLIQELPFSLKLKKFHIDFYSSGMPKLFASDVEVIDHASGRRFEHTIKVNQPLIYNGIAVYQSSFEDGGSRLQLNAYPMQGSSMQSTSLKAEVGTSQTLKMANGDEYQIEWTEFKVFNVENLANEAAKPGTGLNLRDHLGAAAKTDKSKEFKNVGPAFKYKIRDKNGQAKEFHNYMQPLLIDGNWMLLAGVRSDLNAEFRYLRIPVDENDSAQEWLRLHAALQNPALRQQAAQRYALRALPSNMSNASQMQKQLSDSAQRALSVFAGNGQLAGFVAISKFLEQIPADDQGKAADVFVKILNGSLWDLWMVARQQDGLPELQADEKRGRFLQLATLALSDASSYDAPVYLQLQSFDEVKASVLQITRSPGKNLVYLGCLFLVMGVFAMLYIRERRIWCWIKQDGQHSSMLLAMSSQRKTLDFEKEFKRLHDDLPGLLGQREPSEA